MSTQTHTALPAAEELYDMIMTTIEPDLESSMIPYLDMLYDYETDEERKVRMEQYEKAFHLFLERLKEIADRMGKSYQQVKTEVRAKRQEVSAKKDADAMTDIESQFN